MRVFALPVQILRQLGLGAPGLHDVLAHVIRLGLEPEIQIHRVLDEDGTSPPRWHLRVRAEEHVEDLDLDPTVEGAMGAAVAMYLVDLLGELRRELPVVLEKLEAKRGIHVLFPWLASFEAEKGKPS